MPYQANLLTRCPTTLPRLNSNTGAALTAALEEYRKIYPPCAARHNQLADEIEQRERATK
ncbi:hypothetical protein CLM71_14815 [Serratia sp. MYb239]|nr:hypothetical protein [Serratia sp. MYb239]AVJ18317.1 hypothetical protein CLM71_14815 [Serratia sp. MYb239]MEB6337887.1 hypothetical protein [Serratia rhizosphaerae]